MLENLNVLVEDGILVRCDCWECNRIENPLGHYTFILRGSPFYLYINTNSTCWWKIRNGSSAWCRNRIGEELSFSEMFDELPDDVQEKLVFHLDVFSNT